MASEIRVNQIQNRSGLSTVTFSDTGVVLSGITTVGILSATSITGNLTGNVTGNVTGTLTGSISTTSITVGDKFISSSGVGLGATTTTGRNAGVGTAVGTIIYNSTVGIVEVYDGTTWKPTSDNFIQATGGIVTSYYSGGVFWKAHTFTASNTFKVLTAPANNNTVEYLVVGGGGGGTNGDNGTGAGGGGGAGGFRTGIGVTVSNSPGAYSIIVGAGGAPQNVPGNSSTFNSSNVGFSSIVSLGGEGSPGGTSGASGGGGFGRGLPAGTGTPGQGNPGGQGAGTSAPATVGELDYLHLFPEQQSFMPAAAVAVVNK
jgi:hypothetical protein